MSALPAIGDRVVYFGQKSLQSDNPHWPGVVEKVGKRVTVRIFRDDCPPPAGKLVVCSPRSIVRDQIEMLGGLPE